MFFLPESFRFPEALELELSRALWKGSPSASQLQQRAAGLRSLWPKLAKERGIIAEGQKHYSFLREEVEAYASYYLPANALKVALVLEEAWLLGLDAMPAPQAQWLDLGTGPGTAFWGAAWWAQGRQRNLRFTGWDQSKQFADLAQQLAAAGPFGCRPKFASPSAKGESWENLLRQEKPTHVSLVNSLAEIYPDPEKRLNAIENLSLQLKKWSEADGRERFIILIEPGSRTNSRELASLKDELQKRTPARVLLPCLDARPCGALKEERDWCHEEASCEFPDWLNDLGATVGLRKEALLFSYALISVNGKASGHAGKGRIVSQRLERKGQVECRLCLPEQKRAVRVQRSKATAENEFVLENIRGDIWDKISIGEKGDVEKANRLGLSLPSLFHTI